MKCLKFAQICPKQTLEYTIFVNIKKGQKPFNFWQTVSKRSNGNPGCYVSFNVKIGFAFAIKSLIIKLNSKLPENE